MICIWPSFAVPNGDRGILFGQDAALSGVTSPCRILRVFVIHENPAIIVPLEDHDRFRDLVISTILLLNMMHQASRLTGQLCTPIYIRRKILPFRCLTGEAI